MVKKNLYILTEGGKDIGYGHLTRCISLLQFYPYSKLIIFAKDKGNVEKFLKLQNIPKDRYSFYNWHYGCMPNLKDKFVFIDSYLAKDFLLKKIEKITKKLIFYDDYKQRNYKLYKNSIIINPTFSAKELFFSFKKNILLGPKFLMLRKAFFKVSRKKINKKVKKIFVSLGGNSHKEKNILLNKVIKLLNKFNFEIVIPKNLDDVKMKKIMQEVDLAICAGGQTILELTRVGVPHISVCLADNQLPTLKYLTRKNLTFFAGWYWDKSLLKNIEKYLDILSDFEIRKEISQKLQNLIDGKGTLRIINTTFGKRVTTY